MKNKSTGESGPTMPATVGSDAPTAGPFDFAALVSAIRQLHAHCAARASRAVNVHLTLRNWTIGRYIREFEQNGADRASYGARLLDTLAGALQEGLDRCYTGRYLGLCRQLYDVYPAIGKSMISEFDSVPLLGTPPIRPVQGNSEITDFRISFAAASTGGGPGVGSLYSGQWWWRMAI
ncbi:MAG: DUF1016 N-terminal domain-containing protein [Thermoguttaceae bacterium]|jgi:hypothetical protein|nr:DUF1016 N-terminal domain-containing protein [Thermoguttaceae bacterium]